VIFHTDREGNWIFLNPAWTDITGYSVEESIGQNFQLFFIKSKKKKTSIIIKLVDGKKEFSLHDIVVVTKDGQSKTCEVYVKPLRDEHKNVVGINGTIRRYNQTTRI